MSSKPEPATEVDSPLDEAIADYLHRVEHGETIDRQQFLGEHPALAAELAEYFAADAEFNELLDEVLLEEMLAVGPPTERDLESDQGGDLSGVGAFGPDADHPPAAIPTDAEADEREALAGEPAYEPPPPSNTLVWKLAALSAVVLVALGLLLFSPGPEVEETPLPSGNDQPFVDPSVTWSGSGSTAQASDEQRAIWAARPQKLVGHWPLQGANEPAAVDRSSFAHAGKVHGRPRAADNGLNFSGSGQYIDLGNPPHLNFDGPITVAAWVRVQQTNGIRNIVAHGHQTGPNAEFYLRVKEGRFEVGSWNGMDHAVGISIPKSDLGQWVHLAGTYDGSDWRMYRNGQQVARQPGRYGVFEMQTAWAIASRGGTPSRYFAGGVRDVRIYNYALSAAEVGSLAK